MSKADKEPILDKITVLTEFCLLFEHIMSASSEKQKPIPSIIPA